MNDRTEPELWIVVKHWRRFQHYTGRNPPWIKNQTELLHNHNYLELPGEARAILHGLWLEYASASCQLRLSTRSLTRRLNLRVTRQQLDRLVHKGFIEYALAPSYQHASALTHSQEAETETEELRALPDQSQNPPSPRSEAARENGTAGHTLAPLDWQTALDSVGRNREPDLSEEP